MKRRIRSRVKLTKRTDPKQWTQEQLCDRWPSKPAHWLEGAEHPAGAHGRLQLFIGHLAVAAVVELEEGLNGIAAGSLESAVKNSLKLR